MAEDVGLLKIDVMGVAGCGKSTLARALAGALGCDFVEGDEFHLPESRRKMAAGIPLEDADREPWLDRLAVELAARGRCVVLACSALRRDYRDRLRRGAPGLRFVHVDIDRDESYRRVAARRGHPFPASLVDSQFEALESPVGEPGVLAVPATDPTPRQVEAVLRWLGRVPAGPAGGAAPPTGAAR